MAQRVGQLNGKTGKVETRKVSTAMNGAGVRSEGTITTGPFKRLVDRII